MKIKSPLNKLLADNRGKGLFRVDNVSQDEATVWLYDMIVSDSFFEGISAIDFAKQMTAIDAKTIHLRIDSPGGEIFAAQAMAQIIREHAAHTIAHIDGHAASAASWVALAADEVVISPGGMIMIHNSQTISYGDARDLKDTAALLEKVDGILVATYVEATGQDAQQITDWMDAETWFSAEEALLYKFADRIARNDDVALENAIQWNLTAWSKAPSKSPANQDGNRNDQVSTLDHLRRRLRLAEKQTA
ncbi:head maturation protease, ClpP-related [Accumulibacter sp.]|uniref:head maturation protease, ClpP-related n=1 Tax=Accumulibacter sp. TaxID=2053492 RepID=UPI00258C2C86|nr:head maturation protease, ClpP-related [Accumulibacter sp.]HMU31894.1 Clp protease ClpP [Nitrospira sp.]MCM8580270.1 Clp protease ClpP [Accumulibacter sp.]HMW87956.1 Clp protease ClpP [Nitrospira sp.]HNC19018.1 Clp protease ClpP [Accumulibacter sp.]HNI20483.1 Clp protease ClpP [Nitrospira sp.]